MIGKINVTGGFSGKLNLYEQLDEPFKKEGIWAKIKKEKREISLKKSAYETLIDLPHETINLSAKVIENDIYITYNYKSKYYLGKYNTETNIYTQLQEVDYAIPSLNSAALFNNCLYFFGFLNPSYKYDILRNEITEFNSKLGASSNKFVIEVNLETYVLTSPDSSAGDIYKYNFEDNIYTRLRYLRHKPLEVVAIDTDNEYVYIRSSDDDTRFYKERLDREETEIINYPIDGFHNLEQRILAYGKNVFTFFVDYHYNHITTRYKYDPETKVFTKLTDSSYELDKPFLVICGDYLYLIGSNKGNEISKPFTPKSTHRTKLIDDTLHVIISGVKINDFGELKTIENYLGDGEKWLQN